MTELPPGWAWATLGSLGRWSGGGTPSKRVLTYWMGDIPWVSPKDMKVERIRDTIDHISRDAVEKSTTNVVPSGAVLVVTRSGILSHSLPVAVADRDVALNQDLKALVPSDGVVSDYVAWAMRSSAQMILRECSKAGTTVSNIDTSRLLNFAIPLAPLNEQRRIVAAIEEQLSRLDAADALLTSAAFRLRSLREHAYDETHRNGAPTLSLSQLLREPLRNGHSAKASRDGTVRALTLSAVTRNEFIDENTKLTAADESKTKGLWLEPGDIFVERSNTAELVGTAALYDGPRGWAIFPDLLIRVRVGDMVLPEFLTIVLRSGRARSFFRRAAQGIAGSMPKIDQGVVGRLEVPVPSLEEQRRIVAEVDERLSRIDAMRASIERAQRRSKALRAAILDRAFRGELVPQDPADEPAETLLARIRDERDITIK